MTEQELNAKFKMFEQQIMQIQEQLKLVEQAIFDMNTISTGLDELVGKEGEEIMAPIGRGIFVKAKLLSEDLTVDVGEKHFVKKTIPQSKGLIKEQVTKLKESRTYLEKELDKINEDISKTMMAHQQKMNEQNSELK